MSTEIEKKITRFLDEHKAGTVCLASWLDNLGISRDLQKRYRKSGWLESIGTGAFKRPKDLINWHGGLYALQFQANLPIHAGALTALSMQGFAHYLRSDKEKIFLFSPLKTTLPKWFKKYDWQNPVESIRTSFLELDSGLTEFKEKNFSIKISAPERAILECLYLSPEKIDLVECYQIMEGLTNLRPALLQELLETCKSIKVKRLFLYMAEKASHQWLDFIDRTKINLGKGHRSIVKNGVYIADFDISIPQELAEL